MIMATIYKRQIYGVGESKSSKLNNLPKSSDTNIYCRITPPNADPGETKRFLDSILKEKCLNISPIVERKLQEVLEWNHDRGKKYLKHSDRKSLKLLKRHLAKVRHNRIQMSHSEGEQVYQPQNATGDQNFGIEMKKKRQRGRHLCPAIKEIVLKTHGVLDPEILQNFLNQVRSRKKQMEIAKIFVKDFFALSHQLNKVIKSYYFYGKRGAREDSDIEFIKRLKNKLMQESTVKEEHNYSSEKSSFNTEFVSKRIPSQNSNQNNVNYYNQSKAQTSSEDITSGSVESSKFSHKKYLPHRSKSSRISKSPEFCVPKLSFQSKLQRSSVYDGDQIFGIEMKTKRQGGRRLCPAIKEIVLKTHGVLDPEILQNFLNQVRGRKKQMEIAKIFVKDIFALSHQLNEVIKSYYFYGKRGTREDSDIEFIKRLKNKLMQESTAKEEQNYSSE